MASFNPTILDRALKARRLDVSDLSQRIGESQADLSAIMAGRVEPTPTVLKALERELNTPAFSFFMQSLPHFDELIPDYRNTNAIIEPKSRQTFEVIQVARRIQDTAEDALPSWQPFIVADIKNIDTPEVANSVRAALELSREKQNSFKDSREFFYYCRRKIESYGIFVLQDSFPESDGSGFALADRSIPLIVINTKKQTPARRLFTLIHELAHILIGSTGISDPFITKHELEKKCNKFASLVLLPERIVREIFERLNIGNTPSPLEIARAARLLKVSQQATIIRFEQLGLVRRGQASAWLVAVQALGNPDWATGGGGGGRTDEERIKLAKYGFNFAKFIGQSLSNGFLKSIDIYRISGLKPKWQKSYIAYAAVASDDDVE